MAPYPSFADDYQLGRDAYDEADYSGALRLWQPLADAGDSRAQFAVGILYYAGEGVPQNYFDAAWWFNQAAEQGHAAAQFNLGNAYKNGWGVNKDDKEAVRWWRAAAEQNFAPAQFNLGTQYYFGLGVAEDKNEATRWYRRAADNGHERALELFAGATEKTIDDAVANIPDTDVAISGTMHPSPTPDLKRKDWILAQDPNQFTVALAAMENEADVGELAEHHSELSDLAYYRFKRRGKTWYGVIYGVYEQWDHAQAAVEALPPTLRDGQPWVRPMAKIQNFILKQDN